MMVIQSRVDGAFLSAPSKSYGSQGGVARLWSKDIGNALRFNDNAEVEAVIESEWGDGWKYAACKIVNI